MQVYEPDAVVLQCGADSLADDRLGTFNLSVKGHADCVVFLRSFNIPLMLLGGGGYTVKNVARCWCYETAVAVGVDLDNKLPYNEYDKYFGPNFALHEEPREERKVEKNYKKEDLQKMRDWLLDKIGKLQHAPSVQFQTTPPITAVPVQEEPDIESREDDED